ncbi:Membrane-bound lytic murein transglycosylase D precursor [Pigmentiphaga humi]|uniref:Membrane-bound lytic murein transglycosylase D n=1 Tax=Pigmentiphaga humi TaxID=2478468 RepID=A0A3P4B923_9BURK|nr:LysM peptidoglycan-binding domain-containing protein [Pigmentiphaga humi]VCU71645.1 Membrane-bound lytic murein transglycosylase D precursor [Pigmentiphaga humi]
MQLRLRGVWNARAGVREGRPASPFKFMAAACVMALAGCASLDRPADGSDPAAASQAPAVTAQAPAAAPVQRPQPPAGYRLDVPLAVQPADGSLIPETVDLTVQPDDVWTRIRRSFAVPNIDTPLVKEWENFYSARPDYLQRTATRAGKYLYYIIEEIDERGMPSELALLPFVESSFDPWALSRSQASGLWQFIPSTGRGFNLKQDWWRDERRDPIASTKAALDYLQYLFDFQGDWHLALASYNWGEGSVKRAIDKNLARNQPTDYLSLDMPDETRNYIPKLQAIKNIIANPAAYNVALPVIDNQPYFVTITKSRNIDVKLAAQLAEMPLEEFKALNPSFNRGIILGSTEPTLLLPADRIGIFEANLRAHNGALSSWHTHQLGRGETLTSVAKKYGTTIATLRSANGLGPRSRISAGDILMVPAGGAPEPTLVASAGPTPVRAAVPSRAKTAPVRTYKVRKGDTLSAIARQHNVSIDQLRVLNRLKGSSISIGKTLRVQ